MVFIYKRLIIVLAAAACLAALVFAIGPAIDVRQASNLTADSRQVPIIMYHSLLADPDRAGDYVVSPQELESDMLWLLENGYTPVLVSQLIDFVMGSGDLPDKPVAITLDDGHLNNKLYLPGLLEKHGFCATVSVIGEYTQIFSDIAVSNPSYSYLTWSDIAEMAQSPAIEIANHSYFMHSLIPHDKEKRKGYAPQIAEDAADMNRALLEKSGVTSEVYTYPYGFVVGGADDKLREAGFLATLSCNEKINIVTVGAPDCLFSLGRFNRPSGVSTADFMVKAVMGGQ